MPPKDFTAQEQLVSECLEELGLRYTEQVEIGKYVVDFLLEEHIVLEADGVFGHYKKSDQRRDTELLNFNGVKAVVHIVEQEKNRIKQQIMDVFKCQA